MTTKLSLIGKQELARCSSGWRRGRRETVIGRGKSMCKITSEDRLDIMLQLKKTPQTLNGLTQEKFISHSSKVLYQFEAMSSMG